MNRVDEAMHDERNRPAGRQLEMRHCISEQLAQSPWVRRLAKLGYAAKGLLYMIVGGAAGLAVVHVGGRVRGMRGALNLLVESPFGRLSAAMVAAGLCGFILRRFVQILVPPRIGKPPRAITRVLRRTGYGLSGFGHINIAMAALQLTLGLTALNPDGQTPSRDWMRMLLTSKPLDGWLILLSGLFVVGFSISQFYLAATRRFRIDLELERMNRRVERAAFACGIAATRAAESRFSSRVRSSSTPVGS